MIRMGTISFIEAR